MGVYRLVVLNEEVMTDIEVEIGVDGLRRVNTPTDASSEGPVTSVHLTGGLGNQLFQLAAGLFVSRDQPLSLVSTYGYPRLNSLGYPEIVSLHSPSGVQVQTQQDGSFKGILIRKLINASLRSSSTPKLTQSRRIQASLVESVSSVVLRHLLGRSEVLCSSNIGFDPRIVTARHGAFLIGYFQSWRTASIQRVKRQILGMLNSARSTCWLDSMRNFASREDPTVVHVRLGDYLHNPQFGKLHINYFRDGLSRVQEVTDVGRLWVFSDDPGLAAYMLRPLLHSRNARIVAVDSEIPAWEVLCAMSLGKSFVLSNSTFGWWAANLSFASAASIVVPTPWFANGIEVQDLIPDGWQQLARY